MLINRKRNTKSVKELCDPFLPSDDLSPVNLVKLTIKLPLNLPSYNPCDDPLDGDALGVYVCNRFNVNVLKIDRDPFRTEFSFSFRILGCLDPRLGLR